MKVTRKAVIQDINLNKYVSKEVQEKQNFESVSNFFSPWAYLIGISSHVGDDSISENQASISWWFCLTLRTTRDWKFHLRLRTIRKRTFALGFLQVCSFRWVREKTGETRHVIEECTGQKNIRTHSFDNQVESVRVTVQKMSMLGILSFCQSLHAIARFAHYCCSVVCLRKWLFLCVVQS